MFYVIGNSETPGVKVIGPFESQKDLRTWELMNSERREIQNWFSVETPREIDLQQMFAMDPGTYVVYSTDDELFLFQYEGPFDTVYEAVRFATSLSSKSNFIGTKWFTCKAERDASFLIHTELLLV